MHFITVTRKLGAHGTEIARQVAKRLAYKFYDTEAIERAARNLGFLDDVRDIDEKPPSLFRVIFSQKPAVELAHLNAVLYELAKGGDAVFVGRGSHILLKSFHCALHVRITASREQRIRTLVARGYHEEAAARAVDQSDRERAAFARFAFDVNWDTPELYDLVLNTDNLSVALAVETVARIAGSEEVRQRSLDSLAKIEALALTSRVEAALMETGLSLGRKPVVSVELVEPGKIRLAGVVESMSLRTSAEEAVRGVPGVTDVENHIRAVQLGRMA
jgi:cytidylate kinase